MRRLYCSASTSLGRRWAMTRCRQRCRSRCDLNLPRWVLAGGGVGRRRWWWWWLKTKQGIQQKHTWIPCCCCSCYRCGCQVAAGSSPNVFLTSPPRSHYVPCFFLVFLCSLSALADTSTRLVAALAQEQQQHTRQLPLRLLPPQAPTRGSSGGCWGATCGVAAAPFHSARRVAARRVAAAARAPSSRGRCCCLGVCRRKSLQRRAASK